ncbi:MAG: hypothetical protein NTX48_11285 [Planctomycetales bacterium]|nr:hypothetical protein [Planctomycetales bacterium]
MPVSSAAVILKAGSFFVEDLGRETLECDFARQRCQKSPIESLRCIGLQLLMTMLSETDMSEMEGFST